MLRDVDVTVSDGQLARKSGIGVHVKIGVSPAVSDEALVIRNSMNAQRITDRLGLSPLADACMDSVENGAALIYCMPVAATTPGTVTEVVKQGGAIQSVGSMRIEGSPNNRYSIAVMVTKSGGLNTAALRYSFDGGINWSDEVSMPAGGSLYIAPTGLTLCFSEGAEEGSVQFAYGDRFTATSTAPSANNQAILDAMTRVREIKGPFEFIHIVGESSSALWAALGIEADRLFTQYYKPVFILAEARAPRPDEAVRAYIDALVEERRGVNSYFVQVCTARGVYRRMDATVQGINLAGVVSGLYARAGVAQSISETTSFSIPEAKLTRLEPLGIDEITKVGFTKVDNKAAQGDKGLNVDVECIVMGEIIRNSVNAV